MRHRLLAFAHFAARFEIDRVGEALLGFGARLALKPEPLRRRLQTARVVLAGDRLAGAGVVRGAFERGKLDVRLRGLRGEFGGRRNQDRFGTRCPILQSAGRSHDAAAEIDRAAAVGGIGLKEGATAE